MSILLTESEVIEAEKCVEWPGTKFDRYRAIQLALIEKMRKEPVAQYTSDKYGFEIGFTGDPDLLPIGEHQLFRLPTPQELEME